MHGACCGREWFKEGIERLVQSRSRFKKRSLVMRKYCCIPVLTCLGLTVGLGSQTASAQVLSEGFDNLAGLTNWVRINQSSPNPNSATSWFQGNTAAFVAQAGPTN